MTTKSHSRSGAKVAGDLRAHPLRLPVVGVVVAGGERVGAEHDAALDLGAETRARACARTSRPRSSSPSTAQAVTDAVEAGEVRRRLGRGDHVVGGEAVAGVAEARRRRSRRPAPRIRASVARKSWATSGSTPSASSEKSVATPNRMPLRSPPAGSPRRPGCPSRSSRGDRGPRAREEQRRVSDVAGERAALVERRGEGDHPVAGDGAVCGLKADDPAERRRLADRAAGVGAERDRRQAGGHRGGRAARASRRERGRGPRG